MCCLRFGNGTRSNSSFCGIPNYALLTLKTGGLGEELLILHVDQDVKGLVRGRIGILVTEQSAETILFRTFRVEQKVSRSGFNKYSSKGLHCEECTQ